MDPSIVSQGILWVRKHEREGRTELRCELVDKRFSHIGAHRIFFFCNLFTKKQISKIKKNTFEYGKFFYFHFSWVFLMKDIKYTYVLRRKKVISDLLLCMALPLITSLLLKILVTDRIFSFGFGEKVAECSA